MHWIDYTVVGAYLIALLGFGFLFRQQESNEDYFLGGRKLGWFPLTLSTMATQLSAISFVSAPAFTGFRDGGGMKWLTYEFGVPLAMLFLAAVIMPALHRAGVISIYDYLEQRFGRSTRLLLSFVFQISRAFATGIMVYAIAIILQGTAGIPFMQSIIIIGVITILYSLQGGMSAVVYGDAIQMVIIVMGTLLIIGFGLSELGGLGVFLDKVDMDRVQAANFTSYGFDGEGFGVMPMIFGGFVLYASYYGCDQTQAQRALSAKNVGEMKRIIMANGLLRFPVTLLYCIAGLVVGTLAFNTPEFLAQIPAGKPDWMIPVFIGEYLPVGLVGLLLVAILAAAMSSLSSTINSLAAVSVEDFQRITGKELAQKDYLKWARIVGFVWGGITLLLSVFGGSIADTVIEAINKVGSVFYGPILGVFLLAVATRKIRGTAANTGLLAGVALNMVLWLYVPEVFWFWWNFIGFVVTLLVAWLVHVARHQHDGEGGHADVPHMPLMAIARQEITGRDTAVMLGAFAVIFSVTWFLPDIFMALKG